MPEEKMKVKVVQSVKDLIESGPEIQLDLSEDAWAFGALPPYGFYDFKWFLAKDGITVNIPDQGEMYIRMGLEGHLVGDEEWNDTIAYLYLDSRVFRGKGNSTMAGFIQKAGGQKYLEALIQKKTLNAKTIATLAEQIAKKERIIKAEVDWRGQYSWVSNEGEKKGVTQYVQVCRHMTDFPDNPDKKGEKLHIFTYPASKSKDGVPHEIRAQLNVVRLLTKGEMPQPKLVSQPRGQVAQQVAGEVELEEVAGPTIAKNPVAATASTDDDDIQLMLAE